MLRNRRFVAVVAIAVASLPMYGRAAPPAKDKKPKDFVVAELKPDAPDWAQRFFENAESERLKRVREKLDELQKRKRDNRNSRAGKAARDHDRDQIKVTEAEIEELLTNPVIVPTFGGLAPGQANNFLKVNQVLKFGDKVHVQQVISKERALLLVNEEYLSTTVSRGVVIPGQKSRQTTVILNGVSTENWTDRSSQTIKEVLRVTGTETYLTAGGGTNTVFVLEPFDPTQYLVEK